MEKLLKIEKVLPLVERPYTDKSGNTQVFTSKGFVLSDGIDTVFAEMIGDMARAYNDTQFDTTRWYAVQLQVQARTWTDSQGVERYSNEIRIVKL